LNTTAARTKPRQAEHPAAPISFIDDIHPKLRRKALVTEVSANVFVSVEVHRKGPGLSSVELGVLEASRSCPTQARTPMQRPNAIVASEFVVGLTALVSNVAEIAAARHAQAAIFTRLIFERFL
jgi:hypothetical protein